MRRANLFAPTSDDKPINMTFELAENGGSGAVFEQPPVPMIKPMYQMPIDTELNPPIAMDINRGDVADSTEDVVYYEEDTNPKEPVGSGLPPETEQLPEDSSAPDDGIFVIFTKINWGNVALVVALIVIVVTLTMYLYKKYSK